MHRMIHYFSMLSYTDVTKGVIFVMDGEPYLVLDYAFLRMQQRRPTSQVKARNLITGKIVQRTFQQSDQFSNAEIEKEPLNYLYSHRGDYVFTDPKNSKNRITFKEDQIGESAKYLKSNIRVTAYKFNGKIINIELPIKIDYEVKEAPPGFKGDTATGGSKTVILENNLAINVPMFINEGDIVRINTESGEYTERVEKK